MPHDALIVGSGPNGLAAAITLARAGLSVQVLEAKATIGGGTRTAELTLPGFRHDVCSAIHPLGVGSPFFQDLPLAEYGLRWVQPPAALAHPLDDGPAIIVQRSLPDTAAQLGPDTERYRQLVAPLVDRWGGLAREFLGPLRPPRHPVTMALFGLRALWPAKTLAETWFRGERARALFAGMAAHAIMPLERLTTSAFGLLLLTLAHRVGWPLAHGGSQAISDAMAGYLQSLGGEIVTGHEVESLAELPPAKAILLDVTPRGFLKIAGERLPVGYRARLSRYRYGPGVCKVDWALSGPIPWRDPAVAQAATVHLGGTLEEIAASERTAWEGRHIEQPYVLLAQQSLFDETRAPAGQHTGWAYCHVPHGSTVDMTEAIERQVERFAPGFRDLILARHTMTAVDYETYNPNYVGGDINGGVQDLRQLWTRPVARLNPYSTPLSGIYLCSSATPPGGGVHGMAGYHAARAALGAL